MTNSKNKNLTTTLLLIFAFTLLTPISYAFSIVETTGTMGAMETLQGGSQDSQRRSRREPRSRSRDQGAATNTTANKSISTEFESSLKKILTLVNENRKPDAQTLAAANNAIQANKKDIKTFDDRSQCKYLMLSAWSYHFAGDVGKAFLAASKAYKSDPENSDAHISQVALAILADRRPITIKPKTKTTRSRSRQRRSRESDYDMEPMETETVADSPTRKKSNGILQLDIAAIKTNLINPRMKRLELNCVNSTKFSFAPGDSNLCMLFWQLDPKKTTGPVDTIAPSALDNDPFARQPAEPNGFGSSRRRTRTRNYDSYEDDTSQPIDPDEYEKFAFTILFAKSIFAKSPANSSTKFVGVNTDSLENKQKVIDVLINNPTSWAQVIAADPASNASQFANLNIKTPVMAIVTKNGTVKYTGPAAGFLAPMVLESISSVSATAKIRNPQPAEPQVPSPVNRQTSPTSAKAAPPSQNSEDFTQIGQDYQAQKDLSYAQQYIKMGKYTTYKKGIDMCRSILQKYPDTEYAEKARNILRQVPERYQQRYKITNEEMGS
ncbi:MAG TPA: hypothetical protein ENH94_04065 [Phycisphaerales bacterium]|nr:hypothetical protein [Phycisphaerales bacterium]